jgi:hypothetical protein
MYRSAKKRQQIVFCCAWMMRCPDVFCPVLMLLLALGWLLSDALHGVGLAELNDGAPMVVATGWDLVLHFWMLPVMGFIAALLLVFLYMKFFAKNGSCCGQ